MQISHFLSAAKKSWQIAPLADLVRNIDLGGRLCFFRTVSLDDFRAGPNQLGSLICFGLIAALLRNYAGTAAEGFFSVYGVVSYLFIQTLKVAAIYLLCLLTHHTDRLNQAIIAILSADTFLLLLSILAAAIGVDDGIGWLISYSDVWHWALSVWVLLVVCHFVYLIKPHEIDSAIFAGFLYVLLLMAPGFIGIHPHPFWYAMEKDDTENEYSALYRESALYQQHDMLRDKFSQLLPQRPGIDDLYFVGFAGYSYEDVFMDEIFYIRDLMNRRFDTEGRSIGLINNLKTYESDPLATETSLRMTLQRIGQVIDPNEDILFLYLTSHGSKEHELSVSFYYYQLAQIGASPLKSMLEKSGIKWKVIVVSACYSGGFINQLKDPYTIVMTAAAEDRTSFGCGKESDFTYFGDALFRKALERDISFIAGFEFAKKSIQKREAKEELTPSNPQIYVGEYAEDKLRRLEERLRAIGQ